MTLRPAALHLLTSCCLALASPAATPQDQFFDSDGVHIRFVDLGRGEPIVLVHGFTMNLESWNRGNTLRSLERDYRVVALDVRGHGRSDKPHEPGRYGIHMALDVLRLMDHLEIPKAHLVGYSMGGRIAAYLVANYPNRFMSVTFGGSSPRRVWNESEKERLRGLSSRMQERTQPSQDSGGQDYSALAAIPLTLGEMVPENNQLEAIRIPMLAIVGSEDDNALKGTLAFKEKVPSLRLAVIEDATHTGERGAVNRPEFLESLKTFIASFDDND